MDDSEHEQQLLGAVLAGELAESAPAVAALLARRPELRAELQRLRRLDARLHEVGRGEQAALRESLAAPSPLEAQVPHFVARARARRDARARLAWLAAAAAVVLVGVWFARPLWQRVPRVGPRATLGEPAPGTIVPFGPITKDQVFAWNLRVPPGGCCVLRFRAGSGDVRELFAVTVQGESQWPLSSASPEQHRILAALRREGVTRITWEVEVLDRANNVVPGAGGGPLWIVLPE